MKISNDIRAENIIFKKSGERFVSEILIVHHANFH